MKVLIDADILVYSIGFSAEKGGAEPLLKDAKRNLTMTMRTQKEFIIKHFPNVKDEDFSYYITSDDKSNYRFEAATIQPYKGNRKSSSKPKLYKELRQVLQEDWGAIEVSDQEADDEMSIRASLDPQNTLIVSKDKDLRMAPGWHWEMDTSKPPYFTEDIGVLLLYRQPAGRSKCFGTGIKWFYFQTLVGDRVDNIPGVKGWGDVKAYNALKSIYTKEDLEEAVLDIYQKAGYDKDRLEEVKTLLWMRRERGNYV